MNTMKVCEHCVEAIHSHGEEVIVLQNLYEEGICDWCNEKDELLEVVFADED